MALLQGLHSAGYYPEDLMDFWTLLNPEGSYAVYRARWSTRRGLPFLFPLVRQFLYRKEGKQLVDIFHFVSYDWQNFTEDDLHGCERHGSRLSEAENERWQTWDIPWLYSAFVSLVSPLVGLRQCWEDRHLLVNEPLQRDVEKGI